MRAMKLIQLQAMKCAPSLMKRCLTQTVFVTVSQNLNLSTGKSLSEAFFLKSTNPQYDKRLLIDLPVQYMKTTSSEHGKNMLCAKIVLNVKTKTICVHNMFSPCSEFVVFMY